MNVKLTKAIFVTGALFVFPSAAYAHCPLCTIGAGVAAGFAAWLGVSTAAIGIFIGAFGLALGVWIGRVLPKKMKYQDAVLGLLSFLLTVLPLLPLFKDYGSLYVSFLGEYGSFLNRTYLIDKFLAGAIVGALILFVAPYASRWMTRVRKGKSFPYQGIAITFLLLIGASLIAQFVL